MSRPLAAAQPSESFSTTGPTVGPTAGPTVEHALYGLLLAVAFFLRVFRLDSSALLNPVESGQAWAAWAGAFAAEEVLPALAHSPLLYTGQRFLFWLTDGGSDGWARAIPALAGITLVLLPWLLRGTIGRPAALVLALLLAIDPWLLAFSRTGDGAILSAGLGLLLIAGLSQADALSANGRRWLAGAAGLFLITGPLAWLLLPVLIGAALLFDTSTLWPADRNERAGLLTIAGLTALAGATGLLSHWESLGHISTSLTIALDALRSDGGYPLGWGFLRLIVDQPFILILGVLGLAALWRNETPPRPASGADEPPAALERGEGGRGVSPWLRLLTGWLLWGLLLLLLPGRSPLTLLVIGLPLLLSAGTAAARLLAYATRQVNWQDGSLIAAAVSVLLVTTVFWTSHYSSQWGNADFDPLTLLFYGIVPLLALFFVWWAGWRTSSQIFSLLGMALLLLAAQGSAWALVLPGETTKGSALFAQSAQPGVAALTGDVARLSSLRALDPREALVLVDVAPSLQPLLAWRLRSMRKLRFVDGIDPALLADRASLAVTGDVADVAADESLPAGYRGSRYPVLEQWLPTDLTGAGPTARWILLRELKSEPPTTSVVLWARED